MYKVLQPLHIRFSFKTIMLKIRILAGIFVIMIFASCKSSHEDDLVATAFDYKLFKSDLKGLVPPNTSKNDSIAIVSNFINNWVKEKVILNKAEKNLSKDQMNFEELINNYRNSLIIYTYENQLIKQLLDTNITEEEIEEYYNNNIDNFLLKENIIKVNYVKLENKSPYIQRIKQLLFAKGDDPDNQQKLFDLCSKYAVNFFIDSDVWLYFNDILKEVPLETYDQRAFLKSNRNIEAKDDNFIYLIKIIDFKLKESTSPLSFERENIKSIIVNKRKIDIINKMHKEVYDDAYSKNKIKIY
jgi:hypothetical protein